jgi:hypothetical protein
MPSLQRRGNQASQWAVGIIMAAGSHTAVQWSAYIESGVQAHIRLCGRCAGHV